MGGIDKEVAWHSCDEISILGWDVKGGYKNVVEAKWRKQIPVLKERPDNYSSWDMLTIQDTVGQA